MKYRKVLGLDPTTRGFAYIVFEEGRPIDWGTYCLTTEQERVIGRTLELVQRWKPDILIMEDCRHSLSSRCLRVKSLVRAIQGRVEGLGVRIGLVSKWRTQKKFRKHGAVTKYHRAKVVAAMYPDLESRFPPIRKPWQSESDRMSIFVAASLAMTFLASRKALPATRWPRLPELMTAGLAEAPESPFLALRRTPSTSPETRSYAPKADAASFAERAPAASIWPPLSFAEA